MWLSARFPTLNQSLRLKSSSPKLPRIHPVVRFSEFSPHRTLATSTSTELPRYFPLTPWQKITFAYHNSSKLRKVNLWISASVASAWAWWIYSNIETIPETGYRRLNLLSSRFDMQHAHAMVRAINSDVAILQIDGLNPLLTPNDERVLRVVEVMRNLTTSISHLDINDWRVCVLDIPHFSSFSVPFCKYVYVGTDTISGCVDDHELAFQISRQIATCIVDPDKERKSFALFIFGIPCMFLSRTWRSHWVAYTLGSLFAVAGLNHISEELRLRKVDHLSLNIMARAGYDPRSACRAVRREGLLRRFAKSAAEVRMVNNREQRRVESLEKRLPEAIAVMPSSALIPIPIPRPLPPVLPDAFMSTTLSDAAKLEPTPSQLNTTGSESSSEADTESSSDDPSSKNVTQGSPANSEERSEASDEPQPPPDESSQKNT